MTSVNNLAAEVAALKAGAAPPAGAGGQQPPTRNAALAPALFVQNPAALTNATAGGVPGLDAAAAELLRQATILPLNASIPIAGAVGAAAAPPTIDLLGGVSPYLALDADIAHIIQHAFAPATARQLKKEAL